MRFAISWTAGSNRRQPLISVILSFQAQSPSAQRNHSSSIDWNNRVEHEHSGNELSMTDMRVIVRALLYLAGYHASGKSTVWEQELISVLAAEKNEFLTDILHFFSLRKSSEPHCTPDIFFEEQIIPDEQGLFADVDTVIQALVLLAVKLDHQEISKDEIEHFDLFSVMPESADEILGKLRAVVGGNVVTVSASEFLSLSKEGLAALGKNKSAATVADSQRKERTVH